MKINVLFFASLKDKAGVNATELELKPDGRVADLKSALFDRFPNLPRERSTMLVAVNKEFAFDEDPIPAGAEIALFPPVSGG